MRTPLGRLRAGAATVVLVTLALASCTAESARASRARANEPFDEGLEQELQEQAEQTQERIEALQAATEAGTVGLTEPLTARPTPGWAGERILSDTGNDWEPAIAADPNAPFVYVLHNRYGGPDACADDCPDPAMILHVSRDGGRTWRPERFLCRCKGWKGQFDPLLDVVPETGDVVAVWMNQSKVHFSRSSDHGTTWSRPVWIHVDVRWGDKPNLALSDDGKDVYIQFNGPTDGDNYIATSHDGGESWSTERLTNGPRYYFDYGGAVLPDGRVVFSQISFSYTGPHHAAEGTQQIHVFVSPNEGVTWNEILVDELELGSPCTSRSCYADFYDSGPALAEDADGDLLIVYNVASKHEGRQSVYARSS